MKTVVALVCGNPRRSAGAGRNGRQPRRRRRHRRARLRGHRHDRGRAAGHARLAGFGSRHAVLVGNGDDVKAGQPLIQIDAGRGTAKRGRERAMPPAARLRVSSAPERIMNVRSDCGRRTTSAWPRCSERRPLCDARRRPTRKRAARRRRRRSTRAGWHTVTRALRGPCDGAVGERRRLGDARQAAARASTTRCPARGRAACRRISARACKPAKPRASSCRGAIRSRSRPGASLPAIDPATHSIEVRTDCRRDCTPNRASSPSCCCR